MQKENVKIVLVQIGPPCSPDPSDIALFLQQFLSKRHVVDLPAYLWQPILKFFILNKRPKKLSVDYQKLWSEEGFFLKSCTQTLAKKMAEILGIQVESFFLFGQSSLEDFYQRCASQDEDFQTPWLIVPMFPQFSYATSGLIAHHFESFLADKKRRPSVIFMDSFYEHPLYIMEVSAHIDRALQTLDKIDQVVLSFHGMPLAQVRRRQDPYLKQCQRTFDLIVGSLENFNRTRIHLGHQSRFGPFSWSTPYTETLLLKHFKTQTVAVACPGFLVDCLETKIEIEQTLSAEFARSGGQLSYLPCLNDHDSWARSFAKIIGEFIQERDCRAFRF